MDLKTIAILLCLITTINSVPLLNRTDLTCYYSKGSRLVTGTTNRELNIDSSCTKGEIGWFYSNSLVTLHFRKSTSFSVCFKSVFQLGTEKYDVFDTTYDEAVYIGSPYQGHDVCVPSTEFNNLSVTLQPKKVYYGLLVKFDIICDSYDTVHAI